MCTNGLSSEAPVGGRRGCKHHVRARVASNTRSEDGRAGTRDPGAVGLSVSSGRCMPPALVGFAFVVVQRPGAGWTTIAPADADAAAAAASGPMGRAQHCCCAEAEPFESTLPAADAGGALCLTRARQRRLLPPSDPARLFLTHSLPQRRGRPPPFLQQPTAPHPSLARGRRA